MGRNFWGIAWGLVFIIIGALMFLDRLHVLYFDLGEFLSTWWPLALIIIGANMIFNHWAGDKKSKVF